MTQYERPPWGTVTRGIAAAARRPALAAMATAAPAASASASGVGRMRPDEHSNE